VYIIATYTPTSPPAFVQPTFTPLPTATPTPVPGLLDVFLGPPSAGILVGLLCLGGLGVGSIGLLALVASVFYIRSRD
jgi:hypothetical protein